MQNKPNNNQPTNRVPTKFTNICTTIPTLIIINSTSNITNTLTLTDTIVQRHYHSHIHFNDNLDLKMHQSEDRSPRDVQQTNQQSTSNQKQPKNQIFQSRPQDALVGSTKPEEATEKLRRLIAAME